MPALSVAVVPVLPELVDVVAVVVLPLVAAGSVLVALMLPAIFTLCVALFPILMTPAWMPEAVIWAVLPTLIAAALIRIDPATRGTFTETGTVLAVETVLIEVGTIEVMTVEVEAVEIGTVAAVTVGLLLVAPTMDDEADASVITGAVAGDTADVSTTVTAATGAGSGDDNDAVVAVDVVV